MKKIDIPKANVQYNDWKGTSAVDWHSGMEIVKLAKDKGVDVEKYFPVALSTYGVNELFCSLYAVDTNLTNKTHDKIYEYAQSNNGILPIVKFNFKTNFNELQKYIKRLSIVLSSKMDSMISFEQLDEIELD